MLLVGLFLSFSAWAAPVRELASIQHDVRVEHARELLGKRYKKSPVKHAENHEALERTIFGIIKNHLPKKFAKSAHEITDAIIVEATKHGLDPLFVMALIAGESSFNPDARGPVGEIGLMQIRPATGAWMAQKLKTKWRGDNSLKDPLTNIKLGTAYIAWLREKFQGQGQLYLAAYNMGPKNVKSALSRNVRPKDYPIHVMKRYLAFYKDVNRHGL